LIDRAILLSDKRFHDSNLNIVKNILINNGYPEKLINKLMTDTTNDKLMTDVNVLRMTKIV